MGSPSIVVITIVMMEGSTARRERELSACGELKQCTCSKKNDVKDKKQKIPIFRDKTCNPR